MPLASCVRCNKMFNKVEYPVCPACMPEEEADLEKIRNVLAEHSGQSETEADHDKVRAVLANNSDLSAEEVSEMAEVNLSVVHRMVEEGLVIQLSAADKAYCGKCGAPAISMSKRLCPACLAKLSTEVNRARSEIKLEEQKPPAIGHIGSVRETLEKKRK